jgi:hypothetical protein
LGDKKMAKTWMVNATIGIALYVLIYLFVMTLKIEFVMGHDGLKNWFMILFRPLVEIHGRINDSGPHTGMATYKDSNLYGDKIYFSQNGIDFGGYLKSGSIENKGINPGDNVLVIIERDGIETSDDFSVFIQWSLRGIGKNSIMKRLQSKNRPTSGYIGPRDKCNFAPSPTRKNAIITVR